MDDRKCGASINYGKDKDCDKSFKKRRKPKEGKQSEPTTSTSESLRTMDKIPIFPGLRRIAPKRTTIHDGHAYGFYETSVVLSKKQRTEAPSSETDIIEYVAPTLEASSDTNGVNTMSRYMSVAQPIVEAERMRPDDEPIATRSSEPEQLATEAPASTSADARDSSELDSTIDPLDESHRITSEEHCDHDYLPRPPVDDVSESAPRASHLPAIVTQCRHFTYEYKHFDRIITSDTGNCLFESLSHFVRSTVTLTHSAVRRAIADFYSDQDRNETLTAYLGDLSSRKYLVRKRMHQYDTFGGETEILAAATLFQSSIYVFRRKANTENYAITECSPFFDMPPLWKVFGVPEFPIVLVCTDGKNGSSAAHYDALLLKSISSLLASSSMPTLPKMSSLAGKDGRIRGAPDFDDSEELSNIAQPSVARGPVEYCGSDGTLRKMVLQLTAENAELTAGIRKILQEHEEGSHKNFHIGLTRCALQAFVDKGFQAVSQYCECIPVGANLLQIRPIIIDDACSSTPFLLHAAPRDSPLSACNDQAVRRRLESFDLLMTSVAGSDDLRDKAFVIAKYIGSNRAIWSKLEGHLRLRNRAKPRGEPRLPGHAPKPGTHTIENRQLLRKYRQLLKTHQELRLEKRRYDRQKYICIPVGRHAMRIRPMGSRETSRLYHHLPSPKIAATCADRGTIRRRLEPFDRCLAQIAASKDAKEKAFIIQQYLKSKSDVLDAFEPLYTVELRNKCRRLTPAQSCSIMMDLNISGAAMARLRTHLNAFNVNPFASDRKMNREIRNLSSKISLREDLISLREMKDGRESFVDRWCVRAPSLIPYIREMYARTLKYNALRSDANFDDQIWLAIGGDKGGDSTKIVISFGNVQKTGSFNNLHILAMYQGDESEVNLRRALEIYENDWEELKSLKLPAPNQSNGSDEIEHPQDIEQGASAQAMDTLEATEQMTQTEEPQSPENATDDSEAPELATEVLMDTDAVTQSPDSAPKSTQTLDPGDQWPVRILLFGDLLFLHRVMGLSGSSSTYPCIFCTVKQEQLRKMNSSMHEFSAPSRQLIDWDSVGKFGIRSKPLIPVEICDIVPPTLHIMLGIGTDLVNRVEEACHRRDLSLGTDVNATKEYKRLSKLTLEKESELKGATTRCDQIKAILDHAAKETERNIQGTPRKRKAKTAPCAAPICLGSFFEEATLVECSGCGERHHLQCNQKIVFQDGDLLVVNEEVPDWICCACDGQTRTKEDIHAEISALFDDLEVEKKRINAELGEMKQRLEEINDVIKTKIGPATKAFDNALDDLKVNRQSYVGGLLVGNHIRKLITGDGPRVLTAILGDDPSKEGDLLRQLLETLGAITDLMCASRFLTNDEIERLTSGCRQFGELYEKLEGDEFSITPKLHILLHHVPEFARRNKTVGLISEHGLESMHCRFNRFGRRYACIRSPSKRMNLIVKQHVAESVNLAKMRHGI